MYLLAGIATIVITIVVPLVMLTTWVHFRFPHTYRPRPRPVDVRIVANRDKH